MEKLEETLKLNAEKSTPIAMEKLEETLKLNAEKRFSSLRPEVRDFFLHIHNKKVEQVLDQLKTVIDEKKDELRVKMLREFAKDKEQRKMLAMTEFSQGAVQSVQQMNCIQTEESNGGGEKQGTVKSLMSL
uniref:Uncharacterized protein n=1 Tax=Steinernema glaseri TaxID=37863 RepID=A0A1I7Z369_9BILA